MKSILIMSMLFCYLSLSAQYEITKDSVLNSSLIQKLDHMGIDDDYILNQSESEYFNAKFQKERKDFDFRNRKVAFFNSPGGSVMKGKIDYFTTEKDRYSRGYSGNQASLIIFNEKEKTEANGYDAVINYWSKIVRGADFYVKKLKNK